MLVMIRPSTLPIRRSTEGRGVTDIERPLALALIKGRTPCRFDRQSAPGPAASAPDTSERDLVVRSGPQGAEIAQLHEGSSVPTDHDVKQRVPILIAPPCWEHRCSYVMDVRPATESRCASHAVGVRLHTDES